MLFHPTTWTLFSRWNLPCNCNRIGLRNPVCDGERCATVCTVQPEVRRVRKQLQASGQGPEIPVCLFVSNFVEVAVLRSSVVVDLKEVTMTTTVKQLLKAIILRGLHPVLAPRSSLLPSWTEETDSSEFAKRRWWCFSDSKFLRLKLRFEQF